MTDRFKNDVTYRQQMAPRGWTDENIRKLSDLGDSIGQDPALSHRPETARVAFQRTARFEQAAEEIAWRRGEIEWQSSNANTWTPVEWAHWNTWCERKQSGGYRGGSSSSASGWHQR